MRHTAVLLAASLLVSHTGCSFFAGSMVPVTVTSHPEADLYVDGQKVGKGTATIQVKRDMNHIVSAKLDGETASLALGTKLSTTGVLDIVGGFFLLIPFLGLAAAGSRTLEQEVVNLSIEKKAAASK